MSPLVPRIFLVLAVLNDYPVHRLVRQADWPQDGFQCFSAGLVLYFRCDVLAADRIRVGKRCLEVVSQTRLFGDFHHCVLHGHLVARCAFIAGRISGESSCRAVGLVVLCGRKLIPTFFTSIAIARVYDWRCQRVTFPA